MEQEKEIINCPKCNTENSINDTFCKECGAKLKDNINENTEKLICPKCGKENSFNDTFCMECGAKLKQEYNTNKSNIWIKILVIVVILIGFLVCAVKSIEYQEMIAPYETTYNFSDTQCHVSADYNTEYKSISLDATLDEKVEDWQIKELGSSTRFKLEYNGTMGINTYEFKDVQLQNGQPVKGHINFPNSSPESFKQLKDILKTSRVTLNYPEKLEPDSKERAKLKKEYYRRIEEQKRSEQQLDAIGALGAMMLMGGMF